MPTQRNPAAEGAAAVRADDAVRSRARLTPAMVRALRLAAVEPLTHRSAAWATLGALVSLSLLATDEADIHTRRRWTLTAAGRAAIED